MSVEFTPVTTTYEDLPVGYRGRVQAKLAKINLKLAKLGAPAATVVFGPVVEKEHTDEITGWKWTTEHFEHVTATGVEARHAGWTAVASLDHTVTADEAFVTKFPGHFDDAIPEQFRFEGSVCDHCKIGIRRNLTVVFAHDDGRFTRVGTSCVLEYLGVDPATVLWLTTAVASLGEDEEEGYGFGKPRMPSPAEFLAAAAEATRINGFSPTASGWPTRDQAFDIVDGKIRTSAGEKFPGLDQSKGVAVAVAVVAWVAASTEQSDFMVSARLAVRAADVAPRTAGLLAALPRSYSRAMETAAQKAADAEGVAPSEYIGTVGQKLIVTGTVIVDRSFDGDYGTTKLIVVKMATGEEVGTFGSGRTLFGLDVGMTVRIEGKVKAHEDKGYGKRTMLKMAKVFELAADGVTVLPDPKGPISMNHAYGDHDDIGAVPGGGKCYHCVKTIVEASLLVAA